MCQFTRGTLVTSCDTKGRETSERFEVDIGLHQGSALSPFLFNMLVDTIYHEVCFVSSWELVYADDLAINDMTVVGAQERLQLWNNVLTDSEWSDD